MVLISILIPIKNGIEFIEQSIQSVLAQTITDWELLVGINGHPPGSSVYHTAAAYEARDPRIRVLDLTGVQGKPAALAAMVAVARAEWIALLDVDDVWLPTKLACQLPWMAAYDVIGTAARYFGDRAGGPALPLGDITAFDFRRLNPVCNSSVLLRKQWAQWSDEFVGIEDYHLWLELKYKKGARFYNCSQVVTLHRVHSQSAFNAQGNSRRVPFLLERYTAPAPPPPSPLLPAFHRTDTGRYSRMNMVK
jgi:glycosyltransferase involved in cell wall biosynthesis